MSEPALGQRLKQLRQERRCSLSDVARGTGISASFLSLVENGRSDITFGRLVRVAEFYGLHLSELIPAPVQEDALVVRKEERRHLYSKGEGIDVYLLGPDTERSMMPVYAVFDPEGHFAEFTSHEGEEFVHVIEGSLELTIQDREPVVLRAGDSAYYRADRAHSLRNVGKGTARIFGVVTPPNW
jgi:transcriptional regulator with XRE-family HTH domain